MATKPELLLIDTDCIIEKVKRKLDEAEVSHEEAASSLDELINLGRKEAFAEVMPLLYALKRAVLTSAMHSDNKEQAPIPSAPPTIGLKNSGQETLSAYELPCYGCGSTAGICNCSNR